jgi:hypothetical protein
MSKLHMGKGMKKGYIFTLDAIIAILILAIGLAILFYQFSRQNQAVYFTEQLSNDVVGVLEDTKLGDLCVNPAQAACGCPNYPRLAVLVCDDSPRLNDRNASILSMFAEVIETGTHTTEEVRETINEIFVTKNVIDTKRFGFSVMYTKDGTPLELYNTERYPGP